MRYLKQAAHKSRNNFARQEADPIASAPFALDEIELRDIDLGQLKARRHDLLRRAEIRCRGAAIRAEGPATARASAAMPAWLIRAPAGDEVATAAVPRPAAPPSPEPLKLHGAGSGLPLPVIGRVAVTMAVAAGVAAASVALLEQPSQPSSSTVAERAEAAPAMRRPDLPKVVQTVSYRPADDPAPPAPEAEQALAPPLPMWAAHLDHAAASTPAASTPVASTPAGGVPAMDAVDPPVTTPDTNARTDNDANTETKVETKTRATTTKSRAVSQSRRHRRSQARRQPRRAAVPQPASQAVMPEQAAEKTAFQAFMDRFLGRTDDSAAVSAAPPSATTGAAFR